MSKQTVKFGKARIARSYGSREVSYEKSASLRRWRVRAAATVV